MCELFGASLNEPIDLRNELKEFFDHSVKHPHGWGLLRFSEDAYEVFRESVCARESHILEELVEGMCPQTNMLAHIRLATAGSIKIENCHPFTGVDTSGRTWTMIHNGTIYSSSNLMKYLDIQKGDTDSERVFLYLLDLLRDAYMENGTLNEAQRFCVVEKLIMELSERNKLNLMLFDGEILYLHKNMKNTLSRKIIPEGVLFATTPLGEDWEELPMCRVLAYKEGALLFESEEQTSEFVPTLEYISAMAAMHI